MKCVIILMKTIPGHVTKFSTDLALRSILSTTTKTSPSSPSMSCSSSSIIWTSTTVKITLRITLTRFIYFLSHINTHCKICILFEVFNMFLLCKQKGFDFINSIRVRSRCYRHHKIIVFFRQTFKYCFDVVFY